MDGLDLIILAKDFAIKHHRRVNQLYDDLPYYVHLLEVVEFANKFSYLLGDEDVVIAIIGAWLHDTVEDTGLTYNNIKEIFGERVANITVNVTTNIYGKNRDERANDDYYRRVLSDELSLFVKLCDRMANITHSRIYGSSMFKKYKKEYPHFKEMLYNGMYQDMWDFLDDAENYNPEIPVYYPDVEKFDENTIYQVRLPKPIPFAMFQEMYSKGIIPKKDLVKNRYYRGKCRNASVAIWNGYEFVYMRTKFTSVFAEDIKHPEDDNGYDLFIPFMEELNPTDEQRVKY